MTPADLFLELWYKVRILSSSALTRVMIPGEQFNLAVTSLLSTDDGDEVYNKLNELISLQSAPLRKGAMLEAMRLIDEFLYRIHPRAIVVSSRAGMRPPIPSWLQNLQDFRTISGVYSSLNEHRLVPRGPLTRLPRDEFASSGECLSDRFASLSVVEGSLKIDARPINIRHIVTTSSVAEGVMPGAVSGAEIVTFIPVAQRECHLSVSERSEAGRHFFDFSVAEGRDVKACITDALVAAANTDIAFAPELMVSCSAAEDVADSLFLSPAKFRVFILGSGATVEREDGQAWNESSIVNGNGTVLWRQRKLWQAGLDSVRAGTYGLSDPGDKLLMEDNCSGEEVVIADIDGFGRCVVLICQDIEARPLADDLIRTYQPDWVFVPILDSGVDIGRWVHQRAFGLSSLSPARFLIVSSTALADKRGINDAPCGMAVGPKDRSEDDQGRVVTVARVAADVEHGYASITWREDWGKTSLVES